MTLHAKHRSTNVSRTWWGWLWLAGALMACSVAALNWMPTHLRTHREAVTALLNRREVAYRVVVVGQLRRPVPGDCFLHDCRGSVGLVTVIQDRRIDGRIVCHDDAHDCVLTLPGLSIYNEPLPDVAGMWAIPRTWQTQLLVARAWVCGRVAPFFCGRNQDTPRANPSVYVPLY